jgi:hypothetical protein
MPRSLPATEQHLGLAAERIGRAVLHLHNLIPFII